MIIKIYLAANGKINSFFWLIGMSRAANVDRQNWIILNIVINPRNIWAGFGGKSNPFILIFISWIYRFY